MAAGGTGGPAAPRYPLQLPPSKIDPSDVFVIQISIFKKAVFLPFSKKHRFFKKKTKKTAAMFTVILPEIGLKGSVIHAHVSIAKTSDGSIFEGAAGGGTGGPQAPRSLQLPSKIDPLGRFWFKSVR